MKTNKFWLVLTALLLLTPQAYADLNTGLVLNMPSNASVNSTVLREYANNLNFSIVGNATYDSVLQQVNVSASTGYLSAPASSLYNFGTSGMPNWTMAAWFYIPTDDGSNKNLLTPGGGSYNMYCYAQLSSSNEIRCDITNSTFTEQYETTSINTPIGQWFLLVFSGNVTSIKTYVVNSTGSMTTGNTWTIPGGYLKNVAGSPIYYTGSTNSITGGALAGFRLYNRSLNSTEVQELGQLSKNFQDIETIDNITVNYSVSTGDIPNYFYGFSEGYAWPSNVSMEIDKDGVGGVETASNTTWIRNYMTAAGVRMHRVDAAFNSVAYQNRTFKETGENKNDARNVKNLVQYAAEETSAGRPTKVLIIAGYMPTWLAESNTTRCSVNSSTCFYNNESRWKQLIDDYLTYVTTNHSYDSVVEVEAWNEPTITAFWLNNLNEDTQYINRSQLYEQLYNATYSAVKAYNSSIRVGGGGFAFYTYYMSTTIPTWVQTICDNNADFISYHPYPLSLDMDVTMARFYANVTANCAADIEVYHSEWNFRDANVQINQSNTVFAKQIFLGYQYMINTVPGRFLSQLYTFQDANPYGPWVDGYPLQWASVFEANGNLTGTLYTPYNMTKRLYTNHSEESEVFSYSSTEEDIKLIVTNKQGNRRITIMNTGSGISNPINITISGATTTQIRNLDNGTIISSSGGGFYIGELAAYGIVSYEVTTTQNISINATTPSTPVNVSSGSSQLFTIAISNPDSIAVYYSWFVDGVNQTSVYGQTSATVTAPVGNYNVSVQVYSVPNTLTYSWNYTVLPASAVTACSSAQTGIDGLINISRFLVVLALAVILTAIVSIMYSLKDGRDLMETVQLSMMNCVYAIVAVVVVTVIIAIGSSITLAAAAC